MEMTFSFVLQSLVILTRVSRIKNPAPPPTLYNTVFYYMQIDDKQTNKSNITEG